MRNTSKLALAAIVLGILIALAHIILAVTGVMTRPEWISGLAIGVLIAGVGNHLRIFGKGEAQHMLIARNGTGISPAGRGRPTVAAKPHH